MTSHELPLKEKFRYQRQRYYIKDDCDNTLDVISIVCRDEENERNSKMKKFMECKFSTRALQYAKLYATFQLTCYDLPALVMDRLEKEKQLGQALSQYLHPYNEDNSLYD